MFASFFLAGFECSTHRRSDRTRLDLIKETRHEAFCDLDYASAFRHDLRGARDGLRWHLIEAEPGSYSWESATPMMQAARRQQMHVIWDLCHYGYPDWLDIWSADFPKHFAQFCHEAVRVIRRESGAAPAICPVNELSFWAWLGGNEGRMNPWAVHRGGDLKRQLVRAAVAGAAAARAADPDVTIICAEPLINIVPDSEAAGDITGARDYHRAQYESVDMMLGAAASELGGHRGALDVIGVNFYPDNQWRLRGGCVPLGHDAYRPLSDLLAEVHHRYRKPILISETGAEHSARAAWLAYVGQEVRCALARGVPIAGICLYPITEYRGWENERVCQVGMFGMPDEDGNRAVYMPLAEELRRQQTLFGATGIT